jgi:hypothetical protein
MVLGANAHILGLHCVTELIFFPPPNFNLFGKEHFVPNHNIFSELKRATAQYTYNARDSAFTVVLSDRFRLP